ncbi:hypothetical protein PN462_09620 [Spirulina sp. CS-785/01]|uniref:hypothetical protein n=1 Tax=Spirulina sp. CS-785/01 TaxID=3021716 RepID=UPI00232B93A6|nr:hypothetical protein [Spirulina sp. CS-785/01]MDB9313356.1 hypothetical protein [Spirulina sp. CS-785/01]
MKYLVLLTLLVLGCGGTVQAARLPENTEGFGLDNSVIYQNGTDDDDDDPIVPTY